MERLDQHPPAPLEEVLDERLARRGLRLFVKRDDERFLPAYPGDRAFGGNKWRKLHYNLLAAREQGFGRLLTFGGAYSNHIAATASAGRLFGFATVGVIRGDDGIDNPTLRHARACGMRLHMLDRASYRRLDDPVLLRSLEATYGPAYLLPEGGTNDAALRGCAELAGEIRRQLPGGQHPDYYAVAAGTGGTLAGLIAGVDGQSRVVGFPVLRGDFLDRAVAARLRSFTGRTYDNWALAGQYHFGGYARFSPGLIQFIRDFRARHGIELDPIYTGKLFYGVFDLAGKAFFPEGSSIVAIHTGGRQGIAGFNERFPDQRLT